MNRINNHNIQGTKSDLQIRIEFKEYFGIDINEAEAMLKERKSETERAWHQVLVSNGII